MGEKRYVACKDEYGVYLKTPEGDSVHTLSIIADLLNTQAAEIAGLRKTVERFRKAARMVQIDIGSKALRDYDRIPIFVSSLGALMDAMSSLPNPSEIPNSSEFLVTEADQREADKAIADGSAKLKLPETGHGIMEAQDAAEGG